MTKHEIIAKLVAEYIDGKYMGLTEFAEKVWDAALASLPAAPAQPVPQWIKDIYAYLESTLPEGAADEVFRVAPQEVHEALAAAKTGKGYVAGIGVGHSPEAGRSEVAAPAQPPEGWQWVPKEPTAKMTHIGQSVRYDSSWSIGAIYREMLASAPQPEQAAAPDASNHPLVKAAKTNFALAAQVNDLSLLMRRLVHALNYASPNNPIAKKAADYLLKNDLQGTPLRAEDALRAAAAAPVAVDEREAFERWMRYHEGLLGDSLYTRHPQGHYLTRWVQDRWVVWASRAALAQGEKP